MSLTTMSRCQACFTIAAFCSIAANGQQPPAASAKVPDISGLYRQAPMDPRSRNLPPGMRAGTPTERIYKIDGKKAPLQPWAEKLYMERVQATEKGDMFRNTVSRCLPPGLPQANLFSPYPVNIIQTPGQVTMLFEEGNHFRIIRMDSEHPKEVDETFFGDSIGKWEGETLVIDTVGIRDDTTLDWMGFPHSTELHLVERIKRLSPDTLELRQTIEDPKAYTRSFETVAIFKITQDDMREYICENLRFF